jgi:hypothetical protein
MDKSKIKNLILLTLFLVNAILLGLLLADRHRTASEREAAWNELTYIFAREGIALSPEVQEASAVQGYVLRRDAKKEYASIASLLGNVGVDDQGGIIYSYSGDRGTADFQASGDFSVRLEPGALHPEENPADAAESILNKLGIRFDRTSPVLTEGDPVTATFTVTWRGIPIYNAHVNFLFYSGGSIEVSGLRAMDTVAGRGRAGMEPETLLMHFLRTAGEDGNITEVTDLCCGYFISGSASGDAELIPIWRVKTDAGDYYLNGFTGKQEAIP